jgi:hypothetical protein
MSQFSYAQYQDVVAQAEAKGEGTKIGYFKLKDDGDIAIARLNIGSTEDLCFASVHTLGMNGKWIKVSCLNPLGSYSGSCPLCSAHAANPKGAVGKAAKKVFIQMLVSYRDPNSATGYTTPIPVIWDRPAAFSRELANKLMIAGDLRNTLVLITRNGKAGDMQTTYSMDILPADHPVFKPDMIPTDFGAFSNFNIAKHSYWEKTPEEINTYLTTGQFPEAINANASAAPAPAMTMAAQPPVAAPAVAPTPAPAVAIPMPQAEPAMMQAPVTPMPNPVINNTGVAVGTTDTTGAPARNFTGFSF